MPDASTNRRQPGQRLAVASLICGILGLLCFLPAAIAAIIMGTVAVSRIARSPEPHSRMGLARSGRSLGVFGVLLFIIAMIAIPNLLRSRMAPGEASSVGGVRTINTAEITYASTYPKIGFSPSLAALGSGGTDCHQPNEQHACLIDDVLAAGKKSGYHYRYAPVPPKTGSAVIEFTIHADPHAEKANWLERLFGVEPEAGQRHFFSDQSGVIRSETGREAGPQSLPLE